MGGRIRVGISGWRYASWRGDFYPVGLPQARELEYAASQLPSIELNGPFYSLQRPSSYERWRAQTPPGFVFAVKGGRFITHFKRLRDVETALANFFASGVTLLADKLGPVLWQLPERVPFESPVLADFLALLPTSTDDVRRLVELADRPTDTVDVVAPFAEPMRHALEVRHDSFRDDAFAALLEDHGVACVVADTAGTWPELDLSTGDFDYFRLHGHSVLYTSRYSDGSLDHWAERCRRATGLGRDVYVYFDNDARGHAPHDALRLQRRLDANRG